MGGVGFQQPSRNRHSPEGFVVDESVTTALVVVFVSALAFPIALPLISRATKRIVTERFNKKRSQILSHFIISNSAGHSCFARHIVPRNLHTGIAYTVVCVILMPLFALCLLIRLIAGYNPIWYKAHDGVLVIIDSEVFFGAYGSKDELFSSECNMIARERGLLARIHLSGLGDPQLGIFVIPGRVPLPLANKIEGLSFSARLASHLFGACAIAIFAAMAVLGILKVASANASNLYERFFIATMGLWGLFITSKLMFNAKSK